jgi:hypothetical protein
MRATSARSFVFLLDREFPARRTRIPLAIERHLDRVEHDRAIAREIGIGLHQVLLQAAHPHFDQAFAVRGARWRVGRRISGKGQRGEQQARREGERGMGGGPWEPPKQFSG